MTAKHPTLWTSIGRPIGASQRTIGFNRHDRCSQPNASLMSQDEVSIEVLGARLEYLRRLGVGPKPSSSRNNVHSLARDDELNRLREKVTILEGQNQEQTKKIEDFQASVQHLLMRAGFVNQDNEDGTSGGNLAVTSWLVYLFLTYHLKYIINLRKILVMLIIMRNFTNLTSVD